MIKETKSLETTPSTITINIKYNKIRDVRNTIIHGGIDKNTLIEKLLNAECFTQTHPDLSQRMAELGHQLDIILIQNESHQ